MKKCNVFLVMLAMALALAIAAVGCSKGANSGGGTADSKTSGGDTLTTSSGGTFTLTDIPSKYNGAGVTLDAGNREGAFFLYKHPYKFVNVSNGKAVIPLGKYDKGNTIAPDDYSGNDTLDVVIALFSSGNEAVAQVAFGAVKFSKGSATKSWKDAAVIEEREN